MFFLGDYDDDDAAADGFDADSDADSADDDNEHDGRCFSLVSAAAANCKTSRPLSLLLTTFNI